jgi:hypothetical protein
MRIPSAPDQLRRLGQDRPVIGTHIIGQDDDDVLPIGQSLDRDNDHGWEKQCRQ